MDLYETFDLSPDCDSARAYAKFMIAPLKNTVFEISVCRVDFGDGRKRVTGLLQGHNQGCETSSVFSLLRWANEPDSVDCEKALMSILVTPSFCFQALKEIAVSLAKTDNPGFSIEAYFDLLQGTPTKEALVTKPPLL